MGRLMDVEKMLERLIVSRVISSNVIKLPVHVMSDMLPMSMFFVRQYEKLVNEGKPYEVLDVLLDRFRNERYLVIIWFFLKVYEVTEVDLSVDMRLLDLLYKGESTCREVENYVNRNYLRKMRFGVSAKCL